MWRDQHDRQGLRVARRSSISGMAPGHRQPRAWSDAAGRASRSSCRAPTAPIKHPPPMYSQHTDEVLADLGYSRRRHRQDARRRHGLTPATSNPEIQRRADGSARFSPATCQKGLDMITAALKAAEREEKLYGEPRRRGRQDRVQQSRQATTPSPSTCGRRYTRALVEGVCGNDDGVRVLDDQRCRRQGVRVGRRHLQVRGVSGRARRRSTKYNATSKGAYDAALPPSRNRRSQRSTATASAAA